MRALVASGVLVLAIGAAIGAVERGLDVASLLSEARPLAGLSSLDERHLVQLSEWLGIRDGTAEHAVLRANLAAATGKFGDHPVASLLHVLPGALFLVLALGQFVPAIRARYRQWHRNAGRVLLALALVIVVSGLYFGLLAPFGGALESSATAVFGGFMAFAGWRAWRCIRRHDVARHREWMIRMFAVGLGSATIRLVAAAAVFALPMGELLAPRSAGLAMWVGWLVTLLAAELWIRSTRPFNTSSEFPAREGPRPGSQAPATRWGSHSAP